MLLSVTAAWRDAYPGAGIGWLAMSGVDNPPAHAGLQARKDALEAELRSRFGGQDPQAIRTLPAIQAYTAYYKRFKKTYHVLLQLESIIYKGRSIPSVAALVETMFIAELKNQLLTAGHDLDALRLPLVLDIARGDETYTLMRGVEEQLKAGDMFIRDEDGVISSIIYGPDQRTQIRPETRRVLFTVYAPVGVSSEVVRRHLEDIRADVELVSPQAELDELEVLSA